MLIKICLISSLATFFSVDLNKCDNISSGRKMTVVGRAIVIKHVAAVRTDDSVLYCLDGIDDWDKEYLEKRVKVTGRLTIKVNQYHKNNDPEITAISQRLVGTWKIIKKPKWSLVE